MEQKKRDIFISYSRKDLELVRSIKQEIERSTGCDCWMDLNGIESGAIQFTDDIVEGINNCKVFLFMLSDNSQSSEFALKELHYAYTKARIINKKVVIVKICDCEMTDKFSFMYGLSDTIDWKDSPQREKLIRDIHKWTQRNYPLKIVEIINNMVRVDGGTFVMGGTCEQSGEAFGDEKPPHKVTLQSFSIGRYPITQDQWKAVMGTNPSFFNGGDHPVENVSWYDCQAFVKKLNQLTGKQFRLPTEAEWEYAARGGKYSRNNPFSGAPIPDIVGWYDENSDNSTHEVGQKSPNELGLYDMSGNVWEWVQDWKGKYCAEDQVNPIGPEFGYEKVCRGGGWNKEYNKCRVSYRGDFQPDLRYRSLGLRIVMEENHSYLNSNIDYTKENPIDPVIEIQ